MTPRALTIAGSDPSGGAGIQQDLAVFAALGVWGLSAVTAITAQDTASVHRWVAVEPALVRAQIDAVMADIGVDAVKTGMLADEQIVVQVARAVADAGISALVVDPVLRATAGPDLSTAGLVEPLRGELVPRAMLVTPNAAEAEALTGIPVSSRADQEAAGRALLALGAGAALVKGGHVPGPDAVDVLVTAGGVEQFSASRVPVGDVRGTGCFLSAAITANLALGSDLRAAIRDGKALLTAALTRAKKIGGGALVLDPRTGAAPG